MKELLWNDERGLISPPADVDINVLLLDRKRSPRALNEVLESSLLRIVICKVCRRVQRFKINFSLSLYDHPTRTCVEIAETDNYLHFNTSFQVGFGKDNLFTILHYFMTIVNPKTETETFSSFCYKNQIMKIFLVCF